MSQAAIQGSCRPQAPNIKLDWTWAQLGPLLSAELSPTPTAMNSVQLCDRRP